MVAVPVPTRISGSDAHGLTEPVTDVVSVVNPEIAGAVIASDTDPELPGATFSFAVAGVRIEEFHR
jgi:hypothetical protein